VDVVVFWHGGGESWSLLQLSVELSNLGKGPKLLERQHETSTSLLVGGCWWQTNGRAGALWYGSIKHDGRWKANSLAEESSLVRIQTSSGGNAQLARGGERDWDPRRQEDVELGPC